MGGAACSITARVDQKALKPTDSSPCESELTPDLQLAAFTRGEIDIAFTRPLPPGYPDLMATVLTMVAAELGVSIVPEGVQNLRSRQVVFVPISLVLDPILLIMCWNKKQDSPLRDAFLSLVREQALIIQQNFR